MKNTGDFILKSKFFYRWFAVVVGILFIFADVNFPVYAYNQNENYYTIEENTAEISYSEYY